MIRKPAQAAGISFETHEQRAGCSDGARASRLCAIIAAYAAIASTDGTVVAFNGRCADGSIAVHE
jgi:hypothetical protein